MRGKTKVFLRISSLMSNWNLFGSLYRVRIVCGYV